MAIALSRREPIVAWAVNMRGPWGACYIAPPKAWVRRPFQELSFCPLSPFWAIGLAVLLFLFAFAGTAHGLKPESPEVKATIERGVKFLESDGAKDDRLGALALVGLSLYKYSDYVGKPDPNQPRILEAVSKIEKALGNRVPDKLDRRLGTFDLYSTGLSIIFLVEVDAVKYRADIECLLANLYSRQKPHGGWGYDGDSVMPTGDTSMTQYAVLSSWEAMNKGFNVPMESIEKVLSWLMHTQDPSGGFGYQGNPSKDATLVSQSEVKHGMTVAGLGSVYMCSSMLGMVAKLDKRQNDLPPALKEIRAKDKSNERGNYKSRIETKLVHETEGRANQWLQKNYQIDPPGYTHYYLYALERCMSFRDYCERKVEEEPRWYNDGAQLLIKTQGSKGEWVSGAGAVPDTSFGVLFLLRSMQRTIRKIDPYGPGTLVGSRGLPKDLSKVELRGGRVVPRELSGPAEKLLKALGEMQGKDFDRSVDALAELPNDKMETLAPKDREMIRQLVSNNSVSARLAAVRALGRTRDLDNVEVLIYALTDPDAGVARAANDGLLRISRSPTMVQLSDDFSDEDRKMAIDKWKAWYRAIRPKADVGG
jgi:hypothetical protein